MDINEAADEIAELMIPFVERHRKSNNPEIRKYLSDTIEYMCRKIERFCEPVISVAARERALSILPGVDLRRWKWRDQPKHDKGRKEFHFEHMIPCSQMRKLVLEAQSHSEIVRILASMRLAWITKDENDRLTKSGHASRRSDPEQAYRNAGIIIWNRD